MKPPLAQLWWERRETFISKLIEQEQNFNIISNLNCLLLHLPRPGTNIATLSQYYQAIKVCDENIFRVYILFIIWLNNQHILQSCRAGQSCGFHGSSGGSLELQLKPWYSHLTVFIINNKPRPSLFIKKLRPGDNKQNNTMWWSGEM